MSHWLVLSARQPGGWLPSFFREYPWSSEQTLCDSGSSISLPFGYLALQVLMLVLFPLLLGWHFIWALYLSILIPFTMLLMMWAIRRRLFCEVPAKGACLFPRDETSEMRRHYSELLLKVSILWATSLMVVLVCVLSMKLGMGQQWNPFTRTIRLESGSFLKVYEFVEVFLLVSGFFAITGFVWWPMYVFFEGLTTKQRIAAIRKGEPFDA